MIPGVDPFLFKGNLFLGFASFLSFFIHFFFFNLTFTNLSGIKKEVAI